jgi:hypothetical protein
VSLVCKIQLEGFLNLHYNFNVIKNIIMSTVIVSTKDFPFKSKYQKLIEKGVSLTIVSKSKPICRVEPINSDFEEQITEALSNKEQFSKWSQLAQEITLNSPLKGAGGELRQSSQKFKDNFIFRKPPHFNSIENE